MATKLSETDTARFRTFERALPVKIEQRQSFVGVICGRVCRRPDRHIQFPLCGIYTFYEENRLAGEKIHYNRAQLGVFHEPD
ncbi:MAG TPA: hypothetical protein VKE53_12110 [Pseudolabrys sp.]|nr:hypothetical protein [Pseudolabrys sp.]